MKAYERFLKYVQIDTQSDPNATTFPTTAKQKDLGKVLVEELQDLGIDNAFMDDYGYVYACVKGNVATEAFALIAHMDTAADLTGTNVKPRVIENYDGNDIVLNEKYTMRVSEFPEMTKYVGKDLIVTDGNTLLGADDKAGIAEIMAVVEYLTTHPEVEHGDLYVVFTPDEEVGQGTDHFNFDYCPCAFAYTCDGGPIDAIDYENFNAATSMVTITGQSIHPGSAKDKMINASEIAIEFHQLLPKQAKPEFTEGYDGFYHLLEMQGSVEETKMHYIIRNHDRALFESQKEMLNLCADFINKKYKKELVHVTTQDTYYNMKEHFSDKMYIIDIAKQAIANRGFTPRNTAIRGGTDGANLTYMGLPCPNLGIGGGNCHGRYEFACIQDMEEMVNILLEVVRLVKERGKHE